MSTQGPEGALTAEQIERIYNSEWERAREQKTAKEEENRTGYRRTHDPDWFVSISGERQVSKKFSYEQLEEDLALMEKGECTFTPQEHAHVIHEALLAFSWEAKKLLTEETFEELFPNYPDGDLEKYDFAQSAIKIFIINDLDFGNVVYDLDVEDSTESSQSTTAGFTLTQMPFMTADNSFSGREDASKHRIAVLSEVNADYLVGAHPELFPVPIEGDAIEITQGDLRHILRRFNEIATDEEKSEVLERLQKVAVHELFHLIHAGELLPTHLYEGVTEYYSQFAYTATNDTKFRSSYTDEMCVMTFMMSAAYESDLSNDAIHSALFEADLDAFKELMSFWKSRYGEDGLAYIFSDQASREPTELLGFVVEKEKAQGITLDHTFHSYKGDFLNFDRGFKAYLRKQKQFV